MLKFFRLVGFFEVIDFKDEIIIIIDNTKSKNNFFKDILYFILDTLYNGIELLSDFLVK